MGSIRKLFTAHRHPDPLKRLYLGLGVFLIAIGLSLPIHSTSIVFLIWGLVVIFLVLKKTSTTVINGVLRRRPVSAETFKLNFFVAGLVATFVVYACATISLNVLFIYAGVADFIFLVPYTIYTYWQQHREVLRPPSENEELTSKEQADGYAQIVADLEKLEKRGDKSLSMKHFYWDTKK